MTVTDTATKQLERLTYGRDLTGHNRTYLNRMVMWKAKGFWRERFGPKPGEEGCYVPWATQALFDPPGGPADDEQGGML